MQDHFRLARFVAAQDEDGAYDRALAELRAGRKRSHWMWFVLPQLAGLGRSEMARRYAISGVAEARAYLEHPVLGPRLRECVRALLAVDPPDPVRIMGSVDARKLHSSMTLFALACPSDPGFRQLLDRWYGGVRDQATLDLLMDAQHD